jgi:hypothetical protein
MIFERKKKLRLFSCCKKEDKTPDSNDADTEGKESSTTKQAEPKAIALGGPIKGIKYKRRIKKTNKSRKGQEAATVTPINSNNAEEEHHIEVNSVSATSTVATAREESTNRQEVVITPEDDISIEDF